MDAYKQAIKDLLKFLIAFGLIAGLLFPVLSRFLYPNLDHFAFFSVPFFIVSLIDGLLVGFVAFLRSKSRLRNLIEEAVKAEQNTEKILEYSSEALIIVDDQTGQYLYTNPEMNRMYHFPDDIDLSKIHDIDMMAPKQAGGLSPQDLVDEFKRVIRKEGAIKGEMLLQTYDGIHFPAIVSATEFVYKNQTAFIVYITDITIEKRRQFEENEIKKLLSVLNYITENEQIIDIVISQFQLIFRADQIKVSILKNPLKLDEHHTTEKILEYLKDDIRVAKCNVIKSELNNHNEVVANLIKQKQLIYHTNDARTLNFKSNKTFIYTAITLPNDSMIGYIEMLTSSKLLDEEINRLANISSVIGSVTNRLRLQRELLTAKENEEIANEKLKHQNETLEHTIEERTKQLRLSREELVDKLSSVAEFKDPLTAQHIKRVSAYAKFIAQKLNLSKEEIDLIALTAPMHDVGKIGVDDYILKKDGKYTPEEYEAMKHHTEYGAEILKTTSDNKLLTIASKMALEHHEKWDGTGYPKGLKGEEISIYGRIIAIADVFDALTTERPYKETWDIEKTCHYIKDLSGTEFDPTIIDIIVKNRDDFLKLYELLKQ